MAKSHKYIFVVGGVVFVCILGFLWIYFYNSLSSIPSKSSVFPESLNGLNLEFVKNCSNGFSLYDITNEDLPPDSARVVLFNKSTGEYMKCGGMPFPGIEKTLCYTITCDK